MPKLFCIVPMVGGAPNVDASLTPYRGYVLCDRVGNFGAYLFSGTGAQMTALNALPQVVGLVVVTESGNTKWAELDNPISTVVRTRLNTWLTGRGYPTIPTGRTYRQVIDAVYKRLNERFDLSNFDVAE